MTIAPLRRTQSPEAPDLHYAELLEAAQAIKLREISPVELTRVMLDRIESVEPRLHSYATVTPDLALKQAAEAEREIAKGEYRGVLHGVPIAVKDIFNTEGVVTAAGMPIYASNVPDTDATVVKRLKAAGAVMLGKVQLTEAAFAKHHPKITPPVNPWNPDYYTGASSSGSGVATAAGLCFGSLGSDTGGSIRFPCAANGVTGLKPTWGRVSRHGVFTLAESLDHVGPITRSAADAGAILQAIAGLDANDPTTLSAPVPDYLAGLSEGIKGVRIGIDVTYNEKGVDPEIVAAVRQVRKVLEDLGARTKEVSLPDPTAVIAAWATVCGVETAVFHERTYPSRASEYGPAAGGTIAGLIELGRTVTAADLARAHHARLAFSGALSALMTEIDLLLIPTQPRADFTIAQEAALFESSDDLLAFIRFATPFDMSGHPIITLPGGFTAKGLPLSFQLVARHLDESLLIRAGAAYQGTTDWHRRRPEFPES